jgi:DNA polymerase-3 subunit gamma/tau
MVLSIDPSRASDPEIAAESERGPLLDLAKQFSREDLLRAFDVLTKAEYDIRASLQPRYHLEMALLRWIHVRKLVPLSDLMQQMGSGAAPRPAATATAGRASAPVAAPAPARAATPAPTSVTARPVAERSAQAPRAMRPQAPSAPADSPQELKPVAAGEFKEAFLAETRRAKKFFYGTVLAQAKIDFEPDRVVFAFTPQHRALRAQFEQMRPWLETTAAQLAGRRMAVVSIESSAKATPSAREGGPSGEASTTGDGRRDALKEKALAEPNVQAMLDVFAAEITDVEER